MANISNIQSNNEYFKTVLIIIFSSLITESIKCFVINHSHSAIDEVLLQYIVSVLEELGDDESFDLDGFVEMMAAYIPGFETIDR